MEQHETRYWCCTRRAGEAWRFCPTLEELPALLSNGHQVWLDVLRPTEENIAWLRKVFAFHDLALSDILNNETRPKQESYGDILFTVFGAINLNPGEEALDTINLNLFLSEQYVVSVHLQPLKTVRQLKESIEQGREHITRGPDYLYYRLLDGVVDYYFDVFNGIEERLDRLEERIFSHNPTGVQEEILAVRKGAASLRASLGPKRDALKILVYAEFPQLQKDTQTHLRDVLDHVMRMWDTLESQREVINGLMDSHLIQLSNRMNEVMKILSIIATIMLPLSFVTGVFGMNFDAIPGLHSPLGFWLTMLFMGLLAGGMLWIFRAKHIL